MAVVATSVNNNNNFNNNRNGASQTACSPADDAFNGCTLDIIRAARAFGIMSIVLAFIFCIPIGVADLEGLLPNVTTARVMLTFFAVLLMIFQLIFWALFVGLWNRGCSDRAAFRSVPGSAFGPSAPLFIVSWIVSLMLIPMAMTMPGAIVETKAVHTGDPRGVGMGPMGTQPIGTQRGAVNEPVIR